MAFSVNSPPPGVAVTTTPTTKELGSRSFNQLPSNLYKRRSLNGRRFLPTLNGFPFDLNTTRNILADKFPAGLDPSIDAAQSPNSSGTPSSPVAPCALDNSSLDASVSNSHATTVQSPSRTLTVPTNNTGSLLLQLTLGYTTQYKINAGAWTTFSNNTLVTVADTNTIQFQSLNIDPQGEIQITLIDNNTGQTIGAGTLSNTFDFGGGGG